MATSPDAVRVELAAITSAAAADMAAEIATAPVETRLDTLLQALPLIVPTYYDAAGLLAVSWYDELRDEAAPTSAYIPEIIGDPTTDWIEREIAKFRLDVEADFEAEVQRMTKEAARLAEKEIARGFRDSVLGNARTDDEAIGWSRVARPGACKFCRMLADKGAVYRSESTATFGAHTDCHCAARPEFRNGEHGPEASAMQYLASQKRRTDADRAKLRAYLNTNYPDLPG
jgi:hypothetical protein